MTGIPAITDPEVQHLLEQAASWRLLGLLFERPREGWREEVQMLRRETTDAAIAAAAALAEEQAQEGPYLALVGPGGPVSLRGVSYRGMEDPGRMLADLQAFYEAFAFQPQTEEAPDHLSVEAGFVGYLCLKEAYARARGIEEEADVASGAAAQFLDEHLSKSAWAVALRLEESDAGYLALAAAAIAGRTGSRPDAARTPGGSGESCDDCPMGCGLE